VCRSWRSTATARLPRSDPTPAGSDAEQAARRLLESAGLVHVAANVRYKVGELDLVMRDGDALVFIEVRARRSLRYGGAAASVGHHKRVRLHRAANRFLLERFGQHRWPACRFDVVAFEAGRPNWIKAAFDAL
jgi:putative endonuclease